MSKKQSRNPDQVNVTIDHMADAERGLLQEGSPLYNQLRRAFKQGLRNTEILEISQQLMRALRSHRDYFRQKHEYEYFHCLCLVAEIFERYGRNDLALEALQIESETITRVARLKDPSRVDRLPERRILREKIRLMLDWADSYFYQHYQYEQALQQADHCENLLRHEVILENRIPCYGTLAQVYRLKGKIHRQRRDFKAAERNFGKAIAYHYLRLKWRKQRTEEALAALPPDADPIATTSLREKLKDDIALGMRRVAMILSQGFGRIAYQQGYLQRAYYSYLLSARMILHDSQDVIVKAYNRLVISSALRSMEEPEGWRLHKALADAQKAEQHFRAVGNLRFIQQAQYEQGFCYLRQKEFEQAERIAEKILAQARKYKESRWESNALLLKARIEKDQADPEGALQTAAMALEKAGANPSIQTEARLLLAELHLVLHQPAEARGYLESIRKQSTDPLLVDPPVQSDDPLTAARIQFLSAKAYFVEKEFHLAEQAFESGRRIASVIENFYLRQLEHEVKGLLNHTEQIFTIKISEDSSLDFQSYRPKLLEFLIKQANLRSKTKTKSDVAAQLGVSRQTLLQWEQEIVKTQSAKKK